MRRVFSRKQSLSASSDKTNKSARLKQSGRLQVSKKSQEQRATLNVLNPLRLARYHDRIDGRLTSKSNNEISQQTELRDFMPNDEEENSGANQTSTIVDSTMYSSNEQLVAARQTASAF